jgi:hypothetical protein
MNPSFLCKVGVKPGLALRSTIPKLLLGAVVLGGAGSLLSSGAAQAAIVPGNLCWFGVAAGPAGTPQCATYDAVTSPGGTQFTLADKLVNLGALTFGAKSGTLGFQWTPISPPGFEQDQFSLQLDFNPDSEGPYTGEYDYEISVLDPNYEFATAELDSIVSGVPVGTTVTKKIFGFADIVSTDGSNETGVPVNGPVLKVQNIWDVKTGSVLNSFGDTYTQAAKVPGPLPLLGAGIAFGFSRKLRRRISTSAQA